MRLRTGPTTRFSLMAAAVFIAGILQLFTTDGASAQQCEDSDFVTGGGWILPDGNVKANFGVAGGCRNGSFFGHLEYVDHGSGLAPTTPFRVHGTGVTGYFSVGVDGVGPNGQPTGTRDITGTAEINGVAGFTYCVEVTDNGEGESGTGDLFTIQLSNGYSATGTLGGVGPGGGNIQLHKGTPPPTNTCLGGGGV